MRVRGLPAGVILGLTLIAFILSSPSAAMKSHNESYILAGYANRKNPQYGTSLTPKPIEKKEVGLVGETAKMVSMQVAVADDRVHVSNGLIELTFIKDGAGTISCEMLNLVSGKELRFAGKDGVGPWELEVRGPMGETIPVEASGAHTTQIGTCVSEDGKSASIDLTWVGIQLPDDGAIDAHVKVSIDIGSTLTRWGITIQSTSGKYGIWKIKFPLISVALPSNEARVYVPWNMGVALDPLAGARQFAYPSCVATMQFLCLADAAEGVYLGAHDQSGAHKELFFTPIQTVGSKPDRISLGIATLPPDMGIPKAEVNLTFELVAGFYSGGWYEGCEIYRDWTVHYAPWSVKDPANAVWQRSWMKDIDVWFLWSGEGGGLGERAGAMQDWLGVPVAIHWYNWHEIPFDDHYPEYFPPKKDFRQGIAEAHAHGVRVMPYINGRLWDSANASWQTEGAERYCAKDPDGNKYVEIYGSGVPLSPMCPYTQFWQEKVIGIVEKLIKEYGVDAVYIDQIGAAHPAPCFDKTHGHPLGGGDFWVSGYRKMLTDLRARIPGAVLTTEENADPFIDFFDSLLVVNGPRDQVTEGLTPLYPSVYSSRALLFGIQYITESDIKKGVSLRQKFARPFCWGAQLGWIGLDAGMSEREKTYLRTLAQARHSLHEWLVNGEMRKPPEVECKGSIRVEGDDGGRAWEFETSPVISAAWASQDSALLLFTNFDISAHEIRASVDLKSLGLDRSKVNTWRILAGEGLDVVIREDTAAISGFLAPLGVVAIEMEQACY